MALAPDADDFYTNHVLATESNEVPSRGGESGLSGGKRLIGVFRGKPDTYDTGVTFKSSGTSASVLSADAKKFCSPAASNTSSTAPDEDCTSTSVSLSVERQQLHERLLKSVKKEVKQIMEEAVTRKFVHEDSSSITSLCAAVDACLSYGLRRRALGLFKTNSTTALVQKIAKSFPPAFVVVQIVERVEHLQDLNKRSSSSGESTSGSTQRTVVARFSMRYLWIRVALFEKHLAKLVNYIVENASKFYEKDALVADPVSGQILASLLAGPCALDYSRVKTYDHAWADPSADELLRRHRLAAAGATGPGRSFAHRWTAAGSSEDSLPGRRHPSGGSVSGVGSASNLTAVNQARDYVESLHQNPRSTLIYGKNNIVVHPHNCLEPLRGYLSLHHEPSAAGLVLKWTPNELMNGGSARSSPYHQSSSQEPASAAQSIYWEHVIKVRMSDVVYLHCHYRADEDSSSLVLVGHDGVQRPPIIFVKGDRQLLQFLVCLDGALRPLSRLDPPVPYQHPPHRRRAPGSPGKLVRHGDDQSAVERSSDLVFRIVHSGHKPSVVSWRQSSSSSSSFEDERRLSLIPVPPQHNLNTSAAAPVCR